jgi:hypothetical protein
VGRTYDELSRAENERLRRAAIPAPLLAEIESIRQKVDGIEERLVKLAPEVEERLLQLLDTRLRRSEAELERLSTRVGYGLVLTVVLVLAIVIF